MRRTILLFGVVALAAAMFIPATAAAPPKDPAMSPKVASGVWIWTVAPSDPWKIGRQGVVYISTTGTGTWTGTFEGSSVDTSGGKIWPDSSLWILHDISFQGTVEGKTGTLEILATTEQPKPDLKTMTGKWTIISGTGDLVNFHGLGTWYYDEKVGGARYSGTVVELVPSA